MRHGFALVELLVAIAIATLLAAIAFPHLAAISDGAAVRQESARMVMAPVGREVNGNGMILHPRGEECQRLPV